MKNKVKILMGIPGSGKSFTANKLAPDSCIVSADKYWYNCVGDYLFVPKKIASAHAWCFTEFERLLKEGKSIIVVDNTNIRKSHREAYIKKAEEFDYECEIVLPDSPWFTRILPRLRDQTFTDADVHIFFEKNSHDVPFEVIKNMMKNWEE